MQAIEGKIAEILSSYAVVINLGSKDGISEGDKFVIYQIGKEIVDPETNESLGKLEVHKGTVIAKVVQENMCIAETEGEYEEERGFSIPSPVNIIATIAGLPNFPESVQVKKAKKLVVSPEIRDSEYGNSIIVRVGDLVRKIQ